MIEVARRDEPVRYAALGDSVTAGFGDRLPTGEWRGFAALLAESLPGVQLHNLARSGALTKDVATDQLADALRMRPHVATVLIGANDTLRGSFDLTAVADHLQRTVTELRAAGTVVVTACLPEPGRMLRLPGSLARPLARRIEAVNRVIHALPPEVGHAHLADDPSIGENTMWSVDRLHPSEAGHRRLAGLFHHTLATLGFPVGPPPSLVPTSPPPTRRTQIVWMATRGTQWALRRSTDLLPQLARLAAEEWRLTRRGRTAHLEARLAAEIEATLERMRLASPPVTPERQPIRPT